MDKPANIKEKNVISYIEHLEGKLKIYDESPYCESYLTIFNQLKSFNAQLELGEEVTFMNEEGLKVTETKGLVDLFAASTDKSFDRTKWYFENILELNKTLDELRKLMTPEQQAELQKKIKNQKLGVAEQLALKAKK